MSEAMGETVVEIRNLTRRFGRKTALDDITLDIPPGSVFGLVGENGAGKTTLIKHLLGLLKAKTGSVRVFGLDPVADPVGVLGRIGYLSEDRDLPDWMRISEFMLYTQAFFPRLGPGVRRRTLPHLRRRGPHRCLLVPTCSTRSSGWQTMSP